MQPIAPLMIEHREIERLIALMQKEGDRIKEDKLTDVDFIDDCIDFIKTYADRCHHGKEENILAVGKGRTVDAACLEIEC